MQPRTLLADQPKKPKGKKSTWLKRLLREAYLETKYVAILTPFCLSPSTANFFASLMEKKSMPPLQHSPFGGTTHLHSIKCSFGEWCARASCPYKHTKKRREVLSPPSPCHVPTLILHCRKALSEVLLHIVFPIAHLEQLMKTRSQVLVMQ